jgi:hypothetical protein
MNCESVQNKVLALPDPRQVSPALREHLDGCPACKAWWQQAARLERLLERLPAPPPPADKKAALIEELTAAGPVIRTVPSVPRPAGPSRLVGLLKTRAAKYAGALAAAVLLAVGGWQLIKPTGTATVEVAAPRHPLLEKAVQRNVALARPQNTPAQRLEILGELADDLSAESRSLARVGTPEDLNQLAEWFTLVVNEGIERQARSLPPGMNPTERRDLLNRLTAKLAGAGRQVDQVAGESPEQAKEPLKKIVDAAQDGQKRLQKILAETGA